MDFDLDPLILTSEVVLLDTLDSELIEFDFDFLLREELSLRRLRRRRTLELRERDTFFGLL
jgi:hypothetical protein